ncbi:MAG: hypothetical protein U5P10_16345 [Spirochaetia bacterium]|nr:hypothetical protein [Spirochaetia bacterium]
MKLNSNLIKNNWIIDPLFIQFDEKQNIIHMIQPINSIKYFKYRGFYIAGFSKKYLASLLFHQEENFKQNLIVCNAYGVVIFDFSDGQKFVREAQRYFLPGTKYPSKSVSLDGEEFQILSSQSEDGSLYIIKFISTTRLMSVPNKVKTWILGSLFFSVLGI